MALSRVCYFSCYTGFFQSRHEVRLSSCEFVFPCSCFFQGCLPVESVSIEVKLVCLVCHIGLIKVLALTETKFSRVGYLLGTWEPGSHKILEDCHGLPSFCRIHCPIYRYFGRNVKKYPAGSHKMKIRSHPIIPFLILLWPRFF